MYADAMTANKRVHTTTVRVTQVGKDWLDVYRKTFDVTEADVVRAALQVAASHALEMDKILDRQNSGF